MQPRHVWIFNGSGGRFPGAVFDSKDKALVWIQGRKLSGVLTCYPVDIGVYDWAIANGLFKPSKPQHASPEFIGRFTTAGQEHYHFENGEQG